MSHITLTLFFYVQFLSKIIIFHKCQVCARLFVQVTFRVSQNNYYSQCTPKQPRRVSGLSHITQLWHAELSLAPGQYIMLPFLSLRWNVFRSDVPGREEPFSECHFWNHNKNNMLPQSKAKGLKKLSPETINNTWVKTQNGVRGRKVPLQAIINLLLLSFLQYQLSSSEFWIFYYFMEW